MNRSTKRMAPMRLACLMVLALIAIAACGGSGDAGGQASGSRGSSGGTLTVGWAQPPDTLNPATTGARTVGPIDSNLFDTLVWLTPNMQVTPDLATKWTMSADGKTYSFTLRQGVKFHDGTPFDASAVVANIQYITNPATRSNIARGLLGPCTTAIAEGQYQLTIQCGQPYAPLLAQLGEPYLGIQSPTAIKTYGADLGDHPVGTGPFQFVSYVPNVSVTLQRNPDYRWAPPALHQDGPATLSKIVLHIITDPQARVGELQSGQSQLIMGAPGVFYKTLGQNGDFKRMAVPVSGMGIFAPINASMWPTSDPAVRRAILYSIDRVGVIKVADNGAFEPTWGPLQKGTIGYDSQFDRMYPYDPAKATQVLTAAGWTKSNGVWTKDGQQLTLTITALTTNAEYGQLAQAIQGYLQKAGMNVSIQQLGSPAWLAANIKGTFSLTPLQYVGVDPDALHFWFLPGQYYNWSHYTDPTVTQLIEQGQVETNQSTRLKLYKQAQQILMDAAVVLPIHRNEDLLLMSNKLDGVIYSGGGFENFLQAKLS